MAPRLPAARRRRQLLDVALDVFAANGFHATSMDQVAEAAGVTKPVLYQHFGSKRRLYAELLDDAGERLSDAVAKATAEATGPREQVVAGFRTYFRFVADDRRTFTILFGSGARRDGELAEVVSRVEEAMANLIAPLIDAGIDAEHQRLLAYAVVGLAESVSRRASMSDDAFDPELTAVRVAELAWAGLRGVRPLSGL